MRRAVPEARNPYNNNKWSRATFTAAAEAGDARNVAIQFKHADGSNVNEVIHVDFYLSTAAAGTNYAAATSGALAAGAAGAVLPVVAGRMGTLTTNAAGLVNLVITDTATRTLYIVLKKPTGELVISGAIAFA